MNFTQPIHPNWPPARVEALRQMIREGRSARQIAHALGGGLTRNAVLGKATRLGLKLLTPSCAPKGSAKAGPKAQRRLQQRSDKWTAEAVPTVADDGPGVALLDARDGQCRWPVGDGTGLEVCGAEAKGAYCPGHRARVYVPLKKKDDEAQVMG